MRLLVANRGEIARRIFRTAADLGWSTMAVYARPDAQAAFAQEAEVAACLGGADLADSYLNQDKILDVALRHRVTAIHPGYGFLSENADFARRVIEAGIIWVGPHPDAIASMGSKIDARGIAEAAGVPLIPGFGDIEHQDDERLTSEASRIGYPILVKAAAGGGGKGIRIAH
ncbi:MAG: biotin carboxylase N-terminal domain-containing protein, partial [Actinomycetota bacterium]|nr:biotin carboxylase N-terminal domain-containing protein [Actinomycetota bacterium]